MFTYVICVGVDCGPLTPLVNGHIVIDETILGSIVTYSCIEGYILSDDGNRICQSNGQWSGFEPVCEALEGNGDCGSLPNPIGGSVVISLTSVGSHVEYTCNEGHKIVSGNEFRYCQDNGVWSGEAAVCEGISIVNLY